jgi:DNA-binding transcriptional ArsR family regulator
MPEPAQPNGDVDLAAVGSALAEPARAKVLLALVDGRSLAASVLAAEAGVAASTTSHHLAVLLDVGLIAVTTRGRHRYFSLANPRVAELIEAAARVAPTLRVTSLRQGTRAHAMRYARRCYDHLAGRLGVAVADALCRDGILVDQASGRGTPFARVKSPTDVEPAPVVFRVTATGATRLAELDIHTEEGAVARACLDWTEQRYHIAGPLGRALMTRLLDLRWLELDSRSRAVRLTEDGASSLPEQLGVEVPAH